MGKKKLKKSKILTEASRPEQRILRLCRLIHSKPKTLFDHAMLFDLKEAEAAVAQLEHCKDHCPGTEVEEIQRLNDEIRA